MSENNLEVMETNNKETTDFNDVDYTDDNSGSGAVVGLVVAGVTGLAALGTVAYKKLKAKNEDKPKKKRKKLMWVEVEDKVDDNVVAEVEAEEIDDEEEATEK